MTWDLSAYRLVTASAYPGMMAPLTEHPSCICVLSGDADPAATDGPVHLSLEALDGVRRRWRFGDVSRLSEFVPTIIGNGRVHDRPILLVPPRSNAKWTDAAEAWPGAVRVATSPMPMVDRIAEDKIYVREALRHLRVPVPQSLVRWSGELDFFWLREQLGEPFVLQSRNGAGGQGTYLIEDHEGLAVAVAESGYDGQWLVSRFAGRTTINVAGVVHVDGVRLLPASLQISGIEELGSGFGAYCGSEFGQLDVEDRALESAYRHAGTIGEWLRRLGHRGLFGADIAVRGRRVAFLEVNPRIQGSSWLLSKLQRGIGAQPCLEQHLEAILGRPLGGSRLGPEPVPGGSHLLMRWGGPRRRVGRAGPEIAGITGRPGIGVVLTPGALVARLEDQQRLASGDGHALTATGSGMVQTVRASLGTIGSPAISAA